MSAKAGGNHQGRRTPLSLTSGIPKLQTQNAHAQHKGQSTTNGNNNKHEQKQKGEHQDAHELKEHAQHKSKKEKAQHNAEISNSQQHNEKKTENGQRNGNEKSQHNGTTDKRAANQKDKDMKDKKSESHGKQQHHDKQKKQVEKQEEQDKKSEKLAAIKEKSSEKTEKQDKSEAAAKEKVATVAKEPEVVQQKQQKAHDESAAKSTAEQPDVIVVAAADTAPAAVEAAMVTSTIEQHEDVQPMDISMSEDMPKPAVCVTPKRPLRDRKTPTPTSTKSADKLNMSPTVVLTRADKAAAVAAVNAANEAQSQMHTTPTKTNAAEKQDEQMESILLEPSPIKSPEQEKRNAELGAKAAAAVAATMSNITNPAATSTPGKPYLKFAAKSELPIGGTPDRNTYARSYNQINGRRSIRPISSEYTPAAFQSNMQFRESYRRIPTELDASTTTNTSMNVTVGSELTNNSSFSSFFYRSRKRDRAPSTQSLNAEVQNEVPASPPKRARLEGFMHLMASPITMLRARFSKASLQHSAPVLMESNLDGPDDDIDNVQNLSGADENTPPAALNNVAAEDPDNTTDGEHDVTIGKDAANVTEISKNTTPVKTNDAVAEHAANVDLIEAAPLPTDKEQMAAAEVDLSNADNNDDISSSDIQIVETPIASAAPAGKQKNGCAIM